MAQGKTVRVNDVMSYIVTGDSKSSDSAAKRAYSPHEVIKVDSGLVPGRFQYWSGSRQVTDKSQTWNGIFTSKSSHRSNACVLPLTELTLYV